MNIEGYQVHSSANVFGEEFLSETNMFLMKKSKLRDKPSLVDMALTSMFEWVNFYLQVYPKGTRKKKLLQERGLLTSADASKFLEDLGFFCWRLFGDEMIHCFPVVRGINFINPMERGVYIPIRNPYITGKMTIPNIRRLEPYG